VRAYLALIFLIFGLPLCLVAQSKAPVVDPLIVTQMKSDFVTMLKEKQAGAMTDEQMKHAADDLASQVLQQQGSALSFTPDQIHLLQENERVFTDAETKNAYAKLKGAAHGRPMPVVVEFYKSIFDSGKMNPVEQAIFVKLALAIAANTPQ
jgi:hypothetical protein